MKKTGMAICATSALESKRIRSAIEETVRTVAGTGRTANSKSVGRKVATERRLEAIEATKNLSGKDFTVLMNARG